MAKQTKKAKKKKNQRNTRQSLLLLWLLLKWLLFSFFFCLHCIRFAVFALCYCYYYADLRHFFLSFLVSVASPLPVIFGCFVAIRTYLPLFCLCHSAFWSVSLGRRRKTSFKILRGWPEVALNKPHILDHKLNSSSKRCAILLLLLLLFAMRSLCVWPFHFEMRLTKQGEREREREEGC